MEEMVVVVRTYFTWYSYSQAGKGKAEQYID